MGAKAPQNYEKTRPHRRRAPKTKNKTEGPFLLLSLSPQNAPPRKGQTDTSLLTHSKKLLAPLLHQNAAASMLFAPLSRPQTKHAS
jgi:hypothetical protein